MRVYVHALISSNTKDSKKNVVTYVEAIKISEAYLCNFSKPFPGKFMKKRNEFLQFIAKAREDEIAFVKFLKVSLFH